MRVPSFNPRTRRAQAEARKADEHFFRDNPDRCYRRRPSMPFEREGWRKDSHAEEPITMAIRPNVRTLKHVTIALAGDINAIPDEEAFLATLWGHIQFRIATGNGGPITLIGAHEHAELLRTTGHQVPQEDRP